MPEIIKKLTLPATIFFGIFSFTYWFIDYREQIAAITLYPHGPGPLLQILSPLLVALGLLTLYIVYKRTANNTLSIRCSYCDVVLVILGFSLLLLNFAAYVRILFPTTSPLAPVVSIFSHNINFISTLAAQIVWITLFATGLYAMGLLMQRLIMLIFPSWTSFFTRKQKDLLLTLIAYGLGIIGWIHALFFIGIIGYFITPIIVAIFCLLVFTERARFISLIKDVFTRTTYVLSLKNSRTYIIALILIVSTISLIDSLRPSPRGFDDSTTYLNRSNLIAHNEHLIPGGQPFPFELFAATGYAFVEMPYLHTVIVLFFALLGFLAIYCLIQKVTFNKTASLTTATIWLLLPITWTYLFRELKVELLLFFITTLSLTLFLVWVRDYKKVRYLYLSMLLISFAFTIKITAAILILPMLVLMLGISYKNVRDTKTLLITLKNVVLILVAPLIIWILYSLYTGSNIIPEKKYDVLASSHTAIHTPDDSLYRQLGVNPDQCVSTSLQEDLGKFSDAKNSALVEMLSPWYAVITDGNLSKYTYTHTTVLFSFFPTIFLFYIAYRRYILRLRPSYTATIYSILGISYWILWHLFGQNLIWYGYPGLIFFLLIIAYMLSQDIAKKYKVFLYGFTFFVLCTLLVLRISYFAHPFVIQFAATNTDRFQGAYTPLVQILNAPQNIDKNIIMTSSPSIYHIYNNHQRTLLDRHLDKFTCLDQGRNDTQTLERLSKLGIDYIVFNTKMLHDVDTKVPSLQKKIRRFDDLAQKHFTVEVETSTYTLYSLPQ